MAASRAKIMEKLNQDVIKPGVPELHVGDTIKVHARIVEGAKERIQIFQGIVIKQHNGRHHNATFTVRKVSYNIGVERTFPLYSPRIDKIEVVSRGEVRRARLFHLRPLRGKAAKIKSRYVEGDTLNQIDPAVELDTTDAAGTNGSNGVQSTDSSEAASAV